MERLGRSVRRMAEQYQLTSAAQQTRALELWPSLVGPQIAAAVQVRGIRDGVLHLVTRNSNWSQELLFLREQILERYRGELGAGVVRDLRVDQERSKGARKKKGPPPAEVMTPQGVAEVELPEELVAELEAVARCNDPKLENTLRRWLTQEARRGTWKLQHGGHLCPTCGTTTRDEGTLCAQCAWESQVVTAEGNLHTPSRELPAPEPERQVASPIEEEE